jgi:hypothetical protein
MNEVTAIDKRQPAALVQRVIDTVSELRALRTFIKEEMVETVDFGTIPGTPKPTLYLAGAQKVTMYFNARPNFRIERIELAEGHVEYLVYSDLIFRTNDGSANIIAQGVGSATTMESKYRFRNAKRACPSCKEETIFKSKQARGGWYCYAKVGGCGKQYPDGDPAIEDQKPGKVPNENIYDARNTVLKIAKKRAHVDAAIGLGSLAEFFTQDIGEREGDAYDLTVDELEQAAAEAGEKEPDAETKDRLDFLAHAQKQKARIGNGPFYSVLGLAGFEDPEEVPAARRHELAAAWKAIPNQSTTDKTKEAIKAKAPKEPTGPVQGTLP